mgnify:CR=1 FL=1
MKFVNLIDSRSLQPRAAVVREGSAYYLAPEEELGSLIRAGIALGPLAESAILRGVAVPDFSSQRFAPLLTEPGKIICLGLNYFEHAKEGGREKPDYPWLFLRAASSLVGHNEPVIVPRVSEKFDFEAELAVIIGSKARHVKKSEALDIVLGYTCFNDLSVRDYQKKTPQWTIGKNFDGSGAFGPALVLASDLPRGGIGLHIECRVNGMVTQSADTSEMIFTVADVIERLTECMTLHPGDVLVMGTPSGVGFARQPPLWLKPGDRVEVEIENVGCLENPVCAELAR